MQFERAEVLRKKIEHLQHYQARSTVVNPKLGDMDVCSLSSEGEHVYVNFLMMRNGAIVDTKTVDVERKLDETDEDILAFTLAHFREVFASDAPEVVLPFPIHYPREGLTITIPKGGDRKKLLDLSCKNVSFFREEQKRKTALMLSDEEKDMSDILLQLQEDLNLQELPVHIECFDNSNFQGSYPVSAMVCFRNGKPSKQDYRHFNVQTVKGINDFATMKEVVIRRYKRLVADQQPLPQLVIIDGGKGQLNAAIEGISELGLIGRMTIVGLAKNVEEVFFAGDQESLKLPYDSGSLKLLRFIRDEVHRFGITFHRKKRAKGTFKNELEDIKGIGSSTATALLKKFRSVNNIISAPEEELEKLIGKSKAELVKSYFSGSRTAPDSEISTNG